VASKEGRCRRYGEEAWWQEEGDEKEEGEEIENSREK